MAKDGRQALILAVEPDQQQAALLARVIGQRVKADLVVVDSRDAAIAALSARVPDVILLTALLSPRDEDEMVAHLRSLPGADHVQTHTIPQLAFDRPRPDALPAEGGLLAKFRRKKASAKPIEGCDPAWFADEVITFLARAAEMRAHAAPALINRSADRAASQSAPDIAPVPLEDDAGGPSSWSSPFEWRRTDSEVEVVEERPDSIVAATEEPDSGAGDRAARALENIQAAAEHERLRLEAEAADEREQIRLGAEAAERERQHLEAVEAERARARLAEQERARLAAEADALRRRLAEEAADRERLVAKAEAAAERERVQLEAKAAAEREQARVAAEADRERRRLEAETAAREERLKEERLKQEAAAERARIEAAAVADRERARLAAEAAERERRRLEAEAAAREEHIRLEAAERERQRLQAEAAAREERLKQEAAAERARIEAAAVAERERARLAAEAAERDRKRLEAEAAAREQQLKLEAAAERARIEAEAAAERERARLAAETAERERRRIEAEAAAREEQLRLEAAAERARFEAEAAAAREQIQREAEEAAQARAATDRKKAKKERAAARERERVAASAQAELARNERRTAEPDDLADPFAAFRVSAGAPGPLLELMPVNAWARPSATRAAPARETADAGVPLTTEQELRALMAGLALPAPVAAVGYARGCRIRRVRVPALVEPALPTASPVIVSRRALAEMRTSR